jgi:transglycosylase-like protein with SLT domain
LMDALSDMIEQGRPAEREKSFIAAHAGAAAPGQNIAGKGRPMGGNPKGLGHEMMIPYVRRGQDHIAVGNNFVYICSLLAIVMLAASPMMAADIGSVSAKVDAKTLVVRADPRTGRLIRVSTGRASAIISKPAPKEISALVEQAAKAHDVDPLLVHSMIKVESDYNARAVSPKGAEGLMQLTPSTARMLGVSDSFDPEQNIEAGVKYLKYLQSVYKDDRLALAAYNAGPGAVAKYKEVPPYRETQNYVAQVGKRYEDARKASAAKPVAAPVAVEAEKVEEKHPKLEQFVDENGLLHLRTTQ